MSRRVELDPEAGDKGNIPALVGTGGLVGSGLGLILLLFAPRAVALAVLFPSLVTAVIGFTLFNLYHRPRWIKGSKSGFRYCDGEQEYFVRDRDVTGFEVRFKEQTGSSGETTVQVRGAMTVEGEEFRGSIPFAYSYPTDAGDPLGALCDRLPRRSNPEVRASLPEVSTDRSAVNIDERETILQIVMYIPMGLGFLGLLIWVSVWLRRGLQTTRFDLQALLLFAGLVAIGVIGFMLVHRERTITPRKNGFDFARGSAKYFIRDDEVTAFTVTSNVEHQLESSASFLVAGLIEVRGEEFEGTIPFSYRFTHWGTDPLGGLRSRLVRRLASAAGPQADADGELIGDTWELRGDRLLYTDATGERALPLSRLVAVDVSDGVVRIWRTGMDEPFLRISASEPNAIILAEVLRRRIAPAEPTASHDRRSGLLGRMVYERNDSLPKSGVVLGYIGAGVGAIFFVYQGYRVATGVRPQEATGVILATLAVVGAAVGAYFLYRYSHWVLRCYEQGLSFERPGSRRDVRFAKVEWFRCEMIRQFVNGHFRGTDYTFRLKVRGEEEFKYKSSEATQDEALDGIRDHIARTLAVRGLDRLRRGERVRWGAAMWFTPTGLEFGSPGRIVPYSQLAEVRMKEGKYYVHARGEERCLRSGKHDERDFFTGLALLAELRARPLAGARSADAPVPVSEPLDGESPHPTPAVEESPRHASGRPSPGRPHPDSLDEYRRKPRR